MIRPFNRIYQNLLVRVNAQRDVITTLLSKKQSLIESIEVIEEQLTQMLITHSQDPNSENADITDLMDKMTGARNAFFDRKRIRAFEVFLQGAIAYLTTFNEGDTKSDFVELLQKQMQTMLDLHLGENKL